MVGNILCVVGNNVSDKRMACPEILKVSLFRPVIPFRREYTLASGVFKSQSDPADSGKKVDKLEASLLLRRPRL